MSMSSTSSKATSGPEAGSGPYQERLIGMTCTLARVININVHFADACRARGLRSPTYQIVSDRRGTRMIEPGRQTED